MSSSKTTTDGQNHQKWAEERGNKPAVVKGTENNKDFGLLQIHIPG